jgi:hypothetical protein
VEQYDVVMTTVCLVVLLRSWSQINFEIGIQSTYSYVRNHLNTVTTCLRKDTFGYKYSYSDSETPTQLFFLQQIALNFPDSELQSDLPLQLTWSPNLNDDAATTGTPTTVTTTNKDQRPEVVNNYKALQFSALLSVGILRLLCSYLIGRATLQVESHSSVLLNEGIVPLVDRSKEDM